ncbi:MULTISPECIES: sulfur carrier protein ThiS [Prosthecochloris]|uniref:Thiamine biosynthesis protein ThiS n=1 Tax=Prosthecochloris marina TaxID=2017681 RepID=A0A317T6H8_9CHLB|nr:MULTISPECIES: sulfur carrier protein ThiS [Prosthecochloris]PWW82195.1 thiamine biosynthesis protein ThiS [Prosthecochloris marina]UZJ36889.1 sulfur carrier protein ThiS [Prosthecochloris sp. SCSIO W1103]UZJ39831.1 sulfur carrier protein ThiS [Prosthecochloris sp. SCSIO W1102]UZJ40643.1 sulfur carrier protein ThiS [Prosthecochloris sp. SCSIO W1101]
MKLTINGEKKELTSETMTVTELLALQGVEMPDMVSVQINGDFLERDAFDSKVVRDGDEVDFLYFMGGGCSE